MINSISGKLLRKEGSFLVIDVGGFGIKVFVSKNAGGLPSAGDPIFLHTAFFIKQDGVELYGFPEEKDLDFFNLLNSVSGIGPKSALAILDSVRAEDMISAIRKNSADAIIENSNIGRKKAEKIVLELKDKIKDMVIGGAEEPSKNDRDVKAALKNLGYNSKEIDKAVRELPPTLESTGERLKAALKFLRDTIS